MSANDFGNPLKKFKLVFLGEQSGECFSWPRDGAMTMNCWSRDRAIWRDELTFPLPEPQLERRLLSLDSCTIPLTIHTRSVRHFRARVLVSVNWHETHKHWCVTMQATIGIDFLSKTLYLDDRTIRLQLCMSCNHSGVVVAQMLTHMAAIV